MNQCRILLFLTLGIVLRTAHCGSHSSASSFSSNGNGGGSSSMMSSSSDDGNSMAVASSNSGGGGGDDLSNEAGNSGNSGSNERSSSSGFNDNDDGGGGGSSSFSSIGSSSSGGGGDGDYSESEMSATAMSSRCNGNVCKLKINGKTYTSSDGSYASSMVKSGCPPAFCARGCAFVKHTDNCPMCKCQGYGAREPCNSAADCTGAGNNGCSKGVCTYPEPAGKAMKTCAMTNQCPEDEECSSGMCRSSGRKHRGKCMWDYECPEDFFCDRQQMTCYSGGGARHSKKQCVMDRQCGHGQYCKSDAMTCYYE